ncbi:MAG: glutamate ABC transporter substrate-binding protein [Acidimicrobiales bacterium]
MRLGAVVAGAAMFAAACSSDSAGSGGDASAGDSGGGEASGETLKVGVKYDQPLFGVNTPDGVVGFDAEIAKIIGEELGRPVEFQEAVSANRETFLEQGTVEVVVATYTINDARKEKISFAGPYYVAGQDIMVPADNPLGIAGIDDLNSADVTVCTAEGSTSLENLQSMAPDADIVTFDTYSKCADAMGQGRADAVSTDNVILLGLASESDSAYVLVENPFTEEPYGIGVAKDSPLRCEINTILTTIYEDGRWAQAYQDTIGTVVSTTPEPPAVDNEGC